VKYEMFNGKFVGTAAWSGPRNVELDMADSSHRSFFEGFFSAEDSVMGGPMGAETMTAGRRDETEENFTRSMFRLTAYGYHVRPTETT
jgi:hypothetical protein